MENIIQKPVEKQNTDDDNNGINKTACWKQTFIVWYKMKAEIFKSIL